MSQMTTEGQEASPTDMSLKRSCDHLNDNEGPTDCKCDGHCLSDGNGASDASPKNDNTQSMNDDADDLIQFSVVFMKEKHDIKISSCSSVNQLKQLLEEKVGVPKATQKLLYKGTMKEEMSLADCGVKTGSKMILMGSRLDEILDIQKPTTSTVATVEDKDKDVEKKLPLSKQKPHAKIIEKGKPDDAMPAFKKMNLPLPPEPLSGMINQRGGKVRLTFKLEQDQVWIGTKERTDKINMTSVRDVVSETIDGHEDYYMVGIQLGPTEASRYWVYWVPCQYVKAIKNTILGD